MIHDDPTPAPGGRAAVRRTLGAAAATLLTLPLLAGGAAAQSAAPELPSLPTLPAPVADIATGSADATGSSGMGVGPASIGLTEIESPAMPAPEGTIRPDFAAHGGHQVVATREVQPCDDLLYSFYNAMLPGAMDVKEVPSCYDVVPTGGRSPVGVEYHFPAGVADGTIGSAPLILLSPGIAANPGMLDRQARLYASHGYVVALGYTFLNWFGYQTELAAKGAVDQSLAPESPLHGKIDFSRTMLVGHSAGGGAVARMGAMLDPTVNGYRDVGFRTAGFVDLMGGPADDGLASPPASVPGLFVVAEHESLVPWPLTRLAYDRHTGPAWWTVVKGATHGSYLDDPKYNAVGALVLSFAEYVSRGDDAADAARADAVYAGGDYRLASDPELMLTERKGV